jgi:hypothetical protein
MMTEEHWIRCGESEAISRNWARLTALGDRISPRKLRLFVCACCRTVPVIANEAHRQAIEIAEQFADGEVTDEVREAADQVAFRAIGMGALPARYCIGRLDKVSDARYASHAAAGAQRTIGTVEEQMTQKKRDLLRNAELLHDVFGDTFCPVVFLPEWRTRTTVAMAQQIYASRDFSALPILADALEDAGCDNLDILAHCRGPGPHVRGCWIVDLLLAKK